jgi:hypothetical protein
LKKKKEKRIPFETKKKAFDEWSRKAICKKDQMIGEAIKNISII